MWSEKIKKRPRAIWVVHFFSSQRKKELGKGIKPVAELYLFLRKGASWPALLRAVRRARSDARTPSADRCLYDPGGREQRRIQLTTSTAVYRKHRREEGCAEARTREEDEHRKEKSQSGLVDMQLQHPPIPFETCEFEYQKN